MELSKLKHFLCYLTTFGLYCRNFEQLPQRHRLSAIFQSKIEEVFVTLETADVDMSTSHFMIEPIFNQNVGNTFHHQNLPNQRQQIHKNTG